MLVCKDSPFRSWGVTLSKLLPLLSLAHLSGGNELWAGHLIPSTCPQYSHLENGSEVTGSSYQDTASYKELQSQKSKHSTVFLMYKAWFLMLHIL